VLLLLGLLVALGVLGRLRYLVEVGGWCRDILLKGKNFFHCRGAEMGRELLKIFAIQRVLDRGSIKGLNFFLRVRLLGLLIENSLVIQVFMHFINGVHWLLLK